MLRAIVGYRQDEEGDWIAELECGHRRHVRHRPPFEERPWVVDPNGRRRRLGTPIECGLCAQGAAAPRLGGDPACFAQELCPACGAVLDGGPHRAGCSNPGV